MADIKSFPNNQDEYVGAEYAMKWLHGRTSGVFAGDGNAAVTAVAGSMAVRVADGVGWIANAENDGIVWWNDTEKTSGAKLQLSVDAADGELGRIDRVIVTWKTTNYIDLPRSRYSRAPRQAARRRRHSKTRRRSGRSLWRASQCRKVRRS